MLELFIHGIITDISTNSYNEKHKKALIRKLGINIDLDISPYRNKHKNDITLKSKQELITNGSITVLVNSLNKNKKENFLSKDEVKELLDLYNNEYLNHLNNLFQWI